MCLKCILNQIEAERQHFAELGLSPAEPVLIRNGFRVFRDEYVSVRWDFYSGHDLRCMFRPNEIQCDDEGFPWANLAKGIFCKAFYIAQLVQYNIGNNANLNKMKSHILKDMLEEAVMSGKCNQLPAVMANRKKAMLEDYKELHRKWEKSMAAWNDKKKALEREASWGNCETPDQQANADIARFIKCKFTDGEQPDQRKTRKCVKLANYSGEVQDLVNEVARVDGLHHHQAGVPPHVVHAIGWSHAKVRRAAEKTALDIRDTYWAEEWEQVKETDGHNELMAAPFNKNGRRPMLESCKGSFALMVPDVREIHPQHNVTSIDISRVDGDVLLAACDFGIVKGVAIMAPTIAQLDNYGKRPNAGPNPSTPVSNNNSNRKKRGQSGTMPCNQSKKRRTGQSTSVPATQAPVRLAPAANGTIHLYLRFRGYETVSGAKHVHNFPYDGHIIFSDLSLRCFEGELYLGDTVSFAKFHGLRLKGDARVRAPQWNNFRAAGATPMTPVIVS